MLRSKDLVPTMVNIPPCEGIGLENEAGTNSYVNRLPGGDPVNVNVCCICIIATPGLEASAAPPNKLIREISNIANDRERHTIRLLYGGFLIIVIPVFLMVIISSNVIAKAITAVGTFDNCQ